MALAKRSILWPNSIIKAGSICAPNSSLRSEKMNKKSGLAIICDETSSGQTKKKPSDDKSVV